MTKDAAYTPSSANTDRIGTYWDSVSADALQKLLARQKDIREHLAANDADLYTRGTLLGELAVSGGLIDRQTLSESLYMQAADRITAARQDITALREEKVTPDALNDALPSYIGGRFDLLTFDSHDLNDANVALGDVARNMVRVAAQNSVYAEKIGQDLAQLHNAMVNMNQFGTGVGVPMATEALNRLRGYNVSVNITSRDGEIMTIGNEHIDAYLDDAARIVKEAGANAPSLLQHITGQAPAGIELSDDMASNAHLPPGTQRNNRQR